MAWQDRRRWPVAGKRCGRRVSCRIYSRRQRAVLPTSFPSYRIVPNEQVMSLTVGREEVRSCGMTFRSMSLDGGGIGSFLSRCGWPARSAAFERRKECAADDRQGLSLPNGFCATIFADKVGHARHLWWHRRYGLRQQLERCHYGNDTPPAGGFPDRAEGHERHGPR